MDLHDFLEAASAQITSRRARPMVLKELSNHIEDQRADYLADGMEHQEAEAEAVRQMGDPVIVGLQLDKVHRPRLEWRILIGVIVLSLMGLCIQIFIQISKVEMPRGQHTLYYFQQAFVLKRQFAWMLIGILTMLIICRVNYAIIGKYAMLMWVLVTGIIIIYCLLATPTNGSYVKITPLAYLWLPTIAGIIYNCRSRGVKGLVMSELFLVVSMVILIIIPSLVTAVIIGVTGFIMLSLSVYKGWFGIKKRRMFFIIALPILVAALTLGICYFTKGMAPYQQERIEAFFHRTENGSFQYINEGMTQFVSNNEEETLSDAAMLAKEDSKGNYLWLYLQKKLGKISVILITLAVFALIFLMFRVSMKQKNRLGFILGVGCSSMLLIQTLMYLAMNLGYVPVTNGLYMPLFSYGPSSLFLTYVYVGLLLSIYHNKDLITN